MNPIRDALIAGVLPGTIAGLSLLAGGVVMGRWSTARRSPIRCPAAAERSTAGRLCAQAATGPGDGASGPRRSPPRLLVGAGMVASMRLLERYDGWWPTGVSYRLPTLVGIAALASAFVAAWPMRGWSAAGLGLLAGGAIAWGIRAPLLRDGSPWPTIALDAAGMALAAWAFQSLVDRAWAPWRPAPGRALVLGALAVAVLPIVGVIFASGISVSARQAAMLTAVLAAGAVAAGVLDRSAGRGVLGGLGVLVALTASAWLLLARALGVPMLSDGAIAWLVLAVFVAGACALLANRIRRAWVLALLVLLGVGGPLALAWNAQQAQGNHDRQGSPSPADYGY
ncbi:MAG: hypothetical protein KatS3mg103_1123 [Phycisphaerales bacterium]|nr:MAG: hypothetical protein KatS3mg103_1123 [Phycisphaerales bacterium]